MSEIMPRPVRGPQVGEDHDRVHPAVPTSPPGVGGLFTVWTWQPVAIAVAALAAFTYARAVLRTPRWPVGRQLLFGLGILGYVWTSCGFLEVYGHVLFWVWTVQALVLLLVVPVLVLAGQPLELARRRGAGLGRFPESGLGRVLSSPVIGPLLVPVASALLVFGPVAGWAAGTPPAEWAIQLLVLVIGAAIALPLVAVSTRLTSLAVGGALALGVFELLLDAVPGIALRLQTHVTTAFFDLRAEVPAGVDVLAPLRDQQRAGGILWVIAELLDLPFLVLVFRQWIRIDAREAQTVDTVLAAEAIARGTSEHTPGRVGSGLSGPSGPSGPSDPDDRAVAGMGESTAPWWETDPRLRGRYRN